MLRVHVEKLKCIAYRLEPLILGYRSDQTLTLQDLSSQDPCDQCSQKARSVNTEPTYLIASQGMAIGFPAKSTRLAAVPWSADCTCSRIRAVDAPGSLSPP